MTTAEAQQIFDDANYLWFYEGLTQQAIATYKEALTLDNQNPVVAYQLAKALYSIGEREEALNYLNIAEQHRDRLSEQGQQYLDEFKEQYMADALGQVEHSFPASQFDIAQLEQKRLTRREWFRIALEAYELELYGVALRAYELYEGDFVDFDLMKDEEEVRYQIELNLGMLEEMSQKSSDEKKSS
ncbi:MAG: tetratricopeptide repeat protein [Cyanobacteria bacterium CRU_2_1]|nr:tetratricopeptide repeat protein [Cyanobacteria bacterium CRU_2_1]